MKIIISELSVNLFIATLVSDLTSAIIIFLALGTVFVLILFFPAFIELKKPKDGGPRSIMEKVPVTKIRVLKTIVFSNMIDIDKDESFGLLLNHRTAEIVKILPTFES